MSLSERFPIGSRPGIVAERYQFEVFHDWDEWSGGPDTAPPIIAHLYCRGCGEFVVGEWTHPMPRLDEVLREVGVHEALHRTPEPDEDSGISGPDDDDLERISGLRQDGKPRRP